MDLIPLRIRGHAINEGKVIIFVPKFDGPIYKWFAPSLQKLFFNIKLDHLGSTVWQAIDDKRNVKKVCEVIIAEQRVPIESIEDMEGRIARFIMDLYAKRLISFMQIVKG